MGWFGI